MKMKILKAFIFFLFFCILSLQAKNPSYLHVKLGGMWPKDIDGGGFKGGLNYGIRFDEVVSFGLGIDYFFKSFTEKDNEKITNQMYTRTTGENKFNMFTALVDLRIDMPFTFLKIVSPFIQIGLGYNFMFNYYKSITEDAKFLFFGGLVFEAETGLMIPLGKKTSLFGSGTLHLSKPSRSSRDDETGVGAEINMYSFILRGGICFNFN
jgi:hypothetical protein